MMPRIAPLLLIIGLAAAPAMADDWYTVEIIVFEHREDASSGSERFPRDPGRPDLLTSVLLVPPTEPRTLRDFERLGTGERQLDTVWRSLTRSARYRPLVHAGWTQIARPPERALPVAVDLFIGAELASIPLHIELPPELLAQAPEPEPEFALELEQESGAEPEMERDEWWLDEPEAGYGTEAEPEPMIESPWAIADRLRERYATPRVPERLRGTVRLVLQRFLHIEADLLLSTDEPLPPEEDATDWFTARDAILEELEMGLIDEPVAVARLEELYRTPTKQAYRLQESRRVRSGEIHYLDHPRFGFIVSVRPLPREEREAREQALEEATERAYEEARQTLEESQAPLEWPEG